MRRGANAGFGRRFAALIYDALLIAGLLMVYTLPIAYIHGSAVLPDTAPGWWYAYRTGLIGIIAGYYVLNWTRSGQTLGMRAWNLHAVSDVGQPLTVSAALLRFLCGAFAWPPAGLGVLWIYLDPLHLAIHDRLSRTRVLYLPRP